MDHYTEYAQQYADIRMHVPSTLQQEAGVYILRTGFNRAKLNYDVGPKSIECYSFHYVIEGHLMLYEGDREYALRAGDLFCLYPEVSYRYKRAEHSPLSLFWAAFSGGQAASVVAALGLTQASPFLRTGLGRRILPLLRDIHEHDNGHPFEQQQLLYQLFSLLHQTQPHGARALEWLEHSKAYIQLHYMEEIRVDKLAEQANVHRSYFSASFMKAYGFSPKGFITKLRMEKAALLLSGGALPVQEVAYEVGYSDLFSFTRAFTNYYGMSPSAYRKNGPSVTT